MSRIISPSKTKQMNNKVFLCGGAVRDLLSNKKPKDMDYVIMASSYDEMLNYILSHGGKIHQERPQFQTIRAWLPKVENADFALPRKDGVYSDHRRPDDTEIASTLLEDSQRRDFTVNAMYKDVDTEEIIDYHNGKADLEAKILRTVGSAYDRFSEDPLRMLRAIRFAITKGFQLDSDIKGNLSLYSLTMDFIKSVKIERAMEELEKCFAFDTELTLSYINEYNGLFSRLIGNSPGQIRFSPKIVYPKK
jgi:tRNA nucleotidyltransferase/poly(A) polymerase